MRRNYSVCVLASILVLFLLTPIIVSSADISLFFPPEWVSRAAQSKEIADTLSKCQRRPENAMFMAV
jgi:hypothetical protein